MATLVTVACLAIGCGSEPTSETTAFPECNGPFNAPSWWNSFAADSVEGLAVDPQGAILVAMRAAVPSDSFKQDLLKLDAHGTTMWKQSIPSSDINWLTTNDVGDVFVGGTAYSGYNTPPSIEGMPIPGGFFMARLNRDGQLIWLHSDKQLPSFGHAGPGLPLLLEQNQALLAFGGNVVTSLNPDTGDLLWRTLINYKLGGWSPFIQSAAVDSNGGIWSSGSFEGTIEVGGFSVTSVVKQDGFLARFSPNGTALGLESFGEMMPHAINALAAHPSGGVLVAKPSATKTSYERRNTDGTTTALWDRPNELMYVEFANENAIYASGIGPFEDGEPMFLEELDGQGSLKWQRTFPLENPELRSLPQCRASALIGTSFVAEGADFGLGTIHCPEARDHCVVVAISRP